MNRKEIVDLITKEVVKTLTKPGGEKIKILVMINTALGVKTFVENLLTLEKAEKFDFSFVFINDKTARQKLLYLENHINVIPDETHIKSVINDFDVVLIAGLDITQLASCANLIANDEVSRAALHCVFNDKRLFIGSDEFNGLNFNFAPALRDIIEGNLKVLRSFNVDIAPLENLPSLLNKLPDGERRIGAGKKIIVKDDILLSFQRGLRKIILNDGDIITPLARDEAQKYGIEVEEKE